MAAGAGFMSFQEVLAQSRPRYHVPAEKRWAQAIYNAPQAYGGYAMPQIRQAVRKLTQQHTQAKFSQDQIWSYWESLWKTGQSFEETIAPIAYWTEPRRYPDALAHHDRLMGWAKDITSWAHSDGLSSLYARFLEDLGGPVDRLLLAWNQSDNPWLRRQSVVSLLYYTRQRKKTPSAHRVLSAVQPLLADDHHYVQKGVGWTIREVYQVDAVKTLAFIEKHLYTIQPAAYAAAVEKLPAPEKKRLRDLRQAWRQSPR